MQVFFNPESKAIVGINIPSHKLTIETFPEIKEVPMAVVNNKIVIDLDLLSAVIDQKLHPCG